MYVGRGTGAGLIKRIACGRNPRPGLVRVCWLIMLFGMNRLGVALQAGWMTARTTARRTGTLRWQLCSRTAPLPQVRVVGAGYMCGGPRGARGGEEGR